MSKKMLLLNMPTAIEQYRKKIAKFPETVWDQRVPFGGFGLTFQKSGGMVWQLKYRVRGLAQANGTFMTLGAFPKMSYAEAVDAATAAIALAKSGVDPKQQAAEATPGGTVAEMAARYIEEYAKRRKRSWRYDERALAQDVVPVIGHMVAADVEHADVMRALQPIVARGKMAMADRVRTIVSTMFKWGHGEFRIKHHPCAFIRPFVVALEDDEESGALPLEPDQVAAFWAGLDAAHYAPQTKLACKFLLATAVRPWEAVGGRWDEIAGGVWTVPASRMKKKRAHRVPLSTLALEILAEARQLHGGKSAFMFPAPKRSPASSEPDRHLQTSTPRHAMKRAREKGELGLHEGQSLYSLRKTAATLVGGLHHPSSGEQYDSDDVGYILAHRRADDTDRYNKAKQDGRKLMMLEQLADEIRRLIAAPAAEVARVAA